MGWLTRLVEKHLNLVSYALKRRLRCLEPADATRIATYGLCSAAQDGDATIKRFTIYVTAAAMILAAGIVSRCLQESQHNEVDHGRSSSGCASVDPRR
jgi:hypothetical protein